MAAWPGWAADVLRLIPAPVTALNERFLNEWQPWEGGSCANNPLNTTERAPGATACNRWGVKNYPTQAVGAQATAATFRLSYYPDLLRALKSGDPFTYSQPQLVAKQITTWGTPRFAAIYLSQWVGPGGRPGPHGTPPPITPPTVNPPRPALHDPLVAWDRLMRILSHKVPAHVNRMHRAGRQIRQLLR